MDSRLERLISRARLYQQTRAFFDGLGYLEVDTPLLGISTNTDRHIQSLKANVLGQNSYLQTSPEFAMKRLLVEGSGSIYQVCHAFRDGERGSLHHPEFAMLEWYSLGFDYQQLMDQVQALIGVLMGQTVNIKQVTYFDCFNGMLGMDLANATLQHCQQVVSEHVPGIDVRQLERDDCLDLLLSQVISKNFSGFTFVYDYPASQASLAKIKQDNPLVAERFELFYHDIELANGFTELTDASEQRARFEQDNRQRQALGLETYPFDEGFLSALDQGLPPCAGVAMGLDRILMLINGKKKIDEVLSLDTLLH